MIEEEKTRTDDRISEGNNGFSSAERLAFFRWWSASNEVPLTKGTISLNEINWPGLVPTW